MAELNTEKKMIFIYFWHQY